jgi:hypothetical protein
MIKLIVNLVVILSAFYSSLSAKEADWGFFIRGSDPSSVMWNREPNGDWTLVAMFEGATLTTYFKKGPCSDKFELNLNPNNIPFKQIFEYRRAGEAKKYKSTKCEYSQLENGLKMLSFSYDEKISVNGSKFESIEGTIVERPQKFIDDNLPKNEIRYDLVKKLS